MVLSNVYTTDSYTTTPVKIEAVDGIALLLHIVGASVYMERNRGHGYEREILLAPGLYTLHRRCTGIRFRSALTGIPALMNIEVIERDD